MRPSRIRCRPYRLLHRLEGRSQLWCQKRAAVEYDRRHERGKVDRQLRGDAAARVPAHDPVDS